MNDETKLLETLERIEALFLGATTPGERTAAADARERIRARLQKIQETDPPIEHKFSLSNLWSRRLFVALLRRYGLEPYRYSGQRYTTVMARVSRSFVHGTLWPEFLELDKALCAHMDAITHRVITEAVYGDDSEAEVKEKFLG